MLCVFMLGFISCDRYEDKTLQDWDDQDNSYYCNQADAINYNWGFPGLINDSICIFPNEVFEGTWYLTDTIFNDTLGIEQIQERWVTIDWVADDTISYKLKMMGFCEEDQPLYFDANRFMLANIVDDLEDTNGQLYCDLTSSISGNIRKDNIDSDTLYLQMLQQTNTDLLFTIKGRAIKN